MKESIVGSMEHARWCQGCGVEVTWTPFIAQGRRYCCARCAGGGACQCGYGIAETEEEDGPAIIES